MTPTNPTDAQMKLAREALAQAATELAPPSSSMRMNDFTDKAAQISARAIVLAIQATEARAQGLVDALTASALRFREYEVSHAAKGNLDGDAKARRNCEMAEQCEQALATWRRT